MFDRYLIEARNRTVAVEGGLIVEPHVRFDVVLSFPDAEIRPGLINAHDHLHRNHYGRLGKPPYANTSAWARDVASRHRDRIAEGRSLPLREALLAGAWKNLFAGVTSVVHHDAWEGDFEMTFPIRVPRITCVDSIGSGFDGVRPGEPYCMHLAEGSGPDAGDEVRTVASRGLLDERLIAVHGVGMDRDAWELFRQSGAALVWCPSSNFFLFDRTAPAELMALGIDVLLGSDSLLSGQGDLLDELRYARVLGLLSDTRLEEAVGCTAARRLGLPSPSLDAGQPADLAVFARPLLDASAADVELVVVDGKPRVAAPKIGHLLEAAGARGRAMTMRGVTRWVSEC